MSDAEFLDHIERLCHAMPPNRELLTLTVADRERFSVLSSRWTNLYVPPRVSRTWTVYQVDVIRHLLRRAVLAKLRS